jgi:hypothetical protein
MSRVTIAELKDRIQNMQKTINLQMQEIIEIQKQNENILNKNNSVSKPQFDGLLKDFELLQMKYKMISTENEKLKGKIKFYTPQPLERKCNERGAGRKSSLTDGQLELILELRHQQLSYNEIAQKVGLSKTYVHKLIREQNDQIK